MYLNIKINILVVMDCYCFDQTRICLRRVYKEAYMDFLHCIFRKNLYFPCYYSETIWACSFFLTLSAANCAHYFQIFSSSSSSCSLRVRCFPCSLVLKVVLVPPSLLRSSNVPSSFCSVFQCLSWQSISVHPLNVM